MKRSDWKQWQTENGSPTATITLTDDGTYIFDKPNDDGTVKAMWYARMNPGDRVVFEVDACLVERVGDPASVGIDYSSAGNLVDESIITEGWKTHTVSWTLPYDAAVGARALITVGPWSGRTGKIAFRNPRLRVENQRALAHYGIGSVNEGNLGHGWESVRLPSFNGDNEVLLLGGWLDTEFRMFGKIFASRNIPWSTSERHVDIEITTGSASGGRTVSSLMRWGNAHGNPRFVRVTYQGNDYLGLTGDHIFSGDIPVFCGYHSNLLLSVVSLGDVTLSDAYSPYTTFDSGYNKLMFNGQEVLHKGIVTTDTNGNYRPSSPIFRVTESAADLADQEFVAAGFGVGNRSAEGVRAEKVETGVYVISGSLGFRREGWYIDNPADANGNVKVYVEYSQDDAGVITLKTYEPDYSSGPVTPGQPIDIPVGRFVALRLEMPRPPEPEYPDDENPDQLEVAA